MAEPNYKVEANPVYDEKIRAWQNDDPANATTILNPVIEKMINNAHALKKRADALDESLSQESGDRNKDVEEINKSIRDINKGIEDINKDISGINKDITDINKDITGIDKEIDGIHGDITGINKNITTINKDITDINTSITNINKNIETQVTNINKNIETQVTNINKNIETQVSTINGKITQINKDIEGANQKITSLTTTVTNNKSAADTHAADKNIHITSAERTKWNAKAETTVASTTANGLMSSTDKAKLNGIAEGANKTTIINNLTTTASGSALDAVQGKTLKDALDKTTASIPKVLIQTAEPANAEEGVVWMNPEGLNEIETTVLTPMNGFAVYSGSSANALTIRKCGNFVFLTGRVNPPATNSLGSATDMVVAKVPSGWEPLGLVQEIRQGTSACVFQMLVKTSGEITASRYRNGNTYTTPAESAQLYINAMWMTKA